MMIKKSRLCTLPTCVKIGICELCVRRMTHCHLLSCFQRLSLGANNITNIHRHAFDFLISLRVLNLTGNRISDPPYLGYICDTLTNLHIANNQISAIPNGYFTGCYNMRSINFAVNYIRALNNNTLIGLDNVKSISFSRNRLNSIACYSFWTLVSVATITLDFNALHYFPCFTFRSRSVPLESINLGYNPIQYIDPSVVKYASGTKYLSFFYPQFRNINFIQHLPNLVMLSSTLGRTLYLDNTTFSNSHALTHISISLSGVQVFPTLTVSKAITISLKLNTNSISCVDISQISGLYRLQYLNLGGNRLQHFPSMSCSDSAPVNATEATFVFPDLKSILLNGNEILVFPVLPGLADKAGIQVQHNSISQFPVGNLAMLERVHYLNLAYNLADVFPDFSELPTANQLSLLHIHHNKIRSIPYTHISTLLKLEELTLHHNYIGSLPDMEFCILQLRHLPLYNNLLEDLSPMIDETGLHWKITEWDISNNNITSLPVPLLQQLTHLEYLDASFNLMEVMPNLTAVAEKIISVNLSFNHIHTIPETHMRNLTCMKQFDLKGNRLTEFPFWTLPLSATLLNLQSNLISTVNRHLRDVRLNDSIVIDIRDNPLTCDRKLCWMRGYKSLQLRRNVAPCATPIPLVGAVFDELTDEQLDCLCKLRPVIWFNIKMSYNKGNPIVEIRRWECRINFTMRVPVLVRVHLYIESAPGPISFLWLSKDIRNTWIRWYITQVTTSLVGW